VAGLREEDDNMQRKKKEKKNNLLNSFSQNSTLRLGIIFFSITS
jgi:hypothetical protein